LRWKGNRGGTGGGGGTSSVVVVAKKPTREELTQQCGLRQCVVVVQTASVIHLRRIGEEKGRLLVLRNGSENANCNKEETGLMTAATEDDDDDDDKVQKVLGQRDCERKEPPKGCTCRGEKEKIEDKVTWRIASQ